MLEQALDRMPHRGAMRLIDEIVQIDEKAILCNAREHSDAEFPLRLNAVLYPSALVELGAQAAAAHASLFGLGAAHTGLILSLSGVVCNRDAVPDDGQLVIRAERVRALDTAASYSFNVDAGDDTILSGEVLLSMVGTSQ